MVRSVQALDSRFPIVNEDGTPSDYFLRFLLDRGTSSEETTDLVEGKADETITITGGTGLTGGGDLTENRVIDLDASIDDLTDVDTTTTPPDDGQALVWNDTDSVWEPGDVAGGGGGGFEELIQNYTLLSNGTIPAINCVGFKEINVTIHGRTTVADGGAGSGITAIYNGDATSYYTIVQYSFNTGGYGADPSFNSGAATLGIVCGAGAQAGMPGELFCKFTGMNTPFRTNHHGSSNFYKDSSGQLLTLRCAGFWNKNDIVHTIQIQQTFVTGTTVTVTGIRTDAVPNPTNVPGGPTSLELTPLPAFQNGWGNYGTYSNLKIVKTGRLVTMIGALSGGASGTVAFTLPVGWRPASLAALDTTYPPSSTIYVIVNTDGTVTINHAGAAYTSFVMTFFVPEIDAYNGGRIMTLKPWYWSPPLASEFTSYSSDATLPIKTDDADLGLIMDGVSFRSGVGMVLAKPLPSAGAVNWTATARLRFQTPEIDIRPGLIALETSTQKVAINAFNLENTATQKSQILSGTSYGSGLSSLANSSISSYNLAFYQWLRISYDSATNQYRFWISTTGKHWRQVHQMAAATAFTTRANAVGFYLRSGVTTADSPGPLILVDHFTVT